MLTTILHASRFTHDHGTLPSGVVLAVAALAVAGLAFLLRGGRK